MISAHCPSCDCDVSPRNDGTCPWCDAVTVLSEQLAARDVERYSAERAGAVTLLIGWGAA
jgi:uncharacterized Zn finger protein (UPF0148 family)